MRVKVFSNGWGICESCVPLAVFCTEVTFDVLSQAELIFVPMGVQMPRACAQWKPDQKTFRKSPFLADFSLFGLFNGEKVCRLRIMETFKMGFQSCFKSFFTVV